MRTKLSLVGMGMTAILCLGIWLFSPRLAHSHCDTLDGPVVMAAKLALEKGDVTPVLKWIKEEHEGEVRQAFQKTLAVRTKGPEAKELADRYFFETLVRLHRAGEGAPYTGLKPAGTVEPIVAKADKALESGSVDDLVRLLTSAMTAGIHERFERVIKTKKHADESVTAGREFVAAYVEFVHYVERLHLDIEDKGIHHGEPAEEARVEGQHKH
ncbi:MAG: DUF6448 family protein [candidate division KSB1 bacterium]|nr:DUF6448 family protein [candidate division KSB1 bacterium]